MSELPTFLCNTKNQANKNACCPEARPAGNMTLIHVSKKVNYQEKEKEHDKIALLAKT